MGAIPWSDLGVVVLAAAAVYVLVRPRSKGQDLVVAATSLLTAVINRATDLAA